MQLNQDMDTRNRGRTIGNGVILAYWALILLLGALTYFGHFEALYSVAIAVVLFASVLGTDTWLQRADMERENDRPEASGA